MNRIPPLATLPMGLLAITILATAPAGAVATASNLVYQIEYIVTPDSRAGGAWVEMKLTQASHLLREVDMRAPAARISQAKGDGRISRENERLVWHPPQDGGSLRWFARIDHRRNDSGYDAHITADWAIFRAEDVIPQAATRTLRGAMSETTLIFDLPPDWSSVTEYFGHDHAYTITHLARRFDRPAGWIILGAIGVRFDRIAGVSVNVAAPINHGMRRIDILAFLNWTLPEVLRVVPGFPRRLAIIGAGDPMWRGGLSGPRSLFLHVDRPLISENATSTLLHEIMHIAIGRGAAADMDWIVEGLAEYYSLTILHRSTTITEKRFTDALGKQVRWGASINKLCTPTSSGAVTARAVGIMHALDGEIRAASDDKKSLDDVILAIVATDEPVTIDGLIALVQGITGSKPDSLKSGRLPGCNS